ncbi:hypothetical protein [Allosalinactinospora lopnorensis]|uniref:hypothetical protein n=1 Tax=Allosalinactinospora lopnorensis TaxID=1352348 RepID=UPI000623DE1F|nr:hypothetical protein [Allosalinactinospora lopnorensis]
MSTNIIETALRDYFRDAPTSGDLAKLRTARRRIAEAKARIADVADHLRDSERRDPDTGDHPLTDDGAALVALQIDTDRLLGRLDEIIGSAANRAEVDR